MSLSKQSKGARDYRARVNERVLEGLRSGEFVRVGPGTARKVYVAGHRVFARYNVSRGVWGVVLGQPGNKRKSGFIPGVLAGANHDFATARYHVPKDTPTLSEVVARTIREGRVTADVARAAFDEGRRVEALWVGRSGEDLPWFPIRRNVPVGNIEEIKVWHPGIFDRPDKFKFRVIDKPQDGYDLAIAHHGRVKRAFESGAVCSARAKLKCAPWFPISTDGPALHFRPEKVFFDVDHYQVRVEKSQQPVKTVAEAVKKVEGDLNDARWATALNIYKTFVAPLPLGPEDFLPTGCYYIRKRHWAQYAKRLILSVLPHGIGYKEWDLHRVVDYERLAKDGYLIFGPNTGGKWVCPVKGSLLPVPKP